jgi:hypothetical protein
VLQTLKMKGLEFILGLSLAVGIPNLSSCTDDVALSYHPTKIGKLTYVFQIRDSWKTDILDRVPFDSTWAQSYIDGNNDHRLNSCYDKAIIYDPNIFDSKHVDHREINYPSKELEYYDSLYVVSRQILKDTSEARGERFRF